MMLMLNVPATLGLIALATPIVQLLFERGQFLPADTAATAAAVQLLRVGLVGYSAARIASPTFYALGRQPRAGARQRRARSRSTSLLSVVAGARARVLAGWRSARRSRRSPTARCWCGCCGAGSAASTGGRSWSRARQSRRWRRSSWRSRPSRLTTRDGRVLLPARASPLRLLRLGASIGGGTGRARADGEAAAHRGIRRGAGDGSRAGYKSCSSRQQFVSWRTAAPSGYGTIRTADMRRYPSPYASSFSFGPGRSRRR